MRNKLLHTSEFYDLKWETMSLDERTHFQLKTLKNLLAYVKKNNPFYGRRFKEADFDPKQVYNLDDLLNRVPFIHKTVMMDEQAKNPPFGNLLTINPDKLARLYYSPGPLLIVFSHHDLNKYVERAAMGLYLAGARPDDIVNISFNYNWVGAGTQHDDAYRRIGCAVLPGGAGLSETHIELMKLTKTAVLSAFPTFAIHLGETAQKMGVDPKRDLSLRLIIVVGEIRTEDDKKQIGEMFGAEVREMYVGNEMGFIGSECPYGGGMHLYSDTIVEVVDPETGRRVSNGESGMLVTTDLHRKKMPIINYRTGDITEGLVYEECPCGRKSPKMKRILGRVGDIPRVKGMFIPPRRVELVISKHKNLCGYQLLIDRPEKKDRLTVRIECPKEDQKKDFENILISEFKVALGILPEVEWTEPGTITEDAPKIRDLRSTV
jgi:phenylacetate-CoA ligase